MNRKRSIFFLCVLILLFGAGYCIMQYVQTLQPKEDASALALPVPEDAQSIQISYAQESFCIFQYGEGWQLASDKDFPLETSLCNALNTTLASLQAVREVDGGDPDSFGLNQPLCRIHAVDVNGTEYEYTLGNYNEYNGLYYLSCGGETIYMLEAAAAESFFIGVYDLIAADEAPDIDADRIYGLSVQSASGTWQYMLEREDSSDGSAYQISGSLLDPNAPDIQHAADPDASLALFKNIALLYLYSCVEYCADDMQTLSEYGLSEPAAQVTVLYEQEDEEGQAQRLSFQYDFGTQTEDGYIYVRMQGSDMIFLAYYNEAAQFLSPDFAALLKTAEMQ